MDYTNPKRNNGATTKMSELKEFDDWVPRAICINCKDTMNFPNIKLALQLLREMKWRCMKCEIIPERVSPSDLRKKMDSKYLKD